MIISLERKKVEAKNEKEGWLPEITRESNDSLRDREPGARVARV